MIWDWQVWGPTLGEIAAWLLFVLVPLGAMCWLLHQPEPRDELGERRRLARIREMAEEQGREEQGDQRWMSDAP